MIAGDFNAPEHTLQIQHARSVWTDTFREIYKHGKAATHEIRWPWGGVFLSHRLDYIFLQPGRPAWQVIDVQHVDAPDGPHSDHRAVLTRSPPSTNPNLKSKILTLLPSLPMHHILQRPSPPVLRRGGQLFLFNRIAKGQGNPQMSVLPSPWKMPGCFMSHSAQAAKEQKIGEVTARIGASIHMRNVLQTAVEELGRALPGSEVVIQLGMDGK